MKRIKNWVYDSEKKTWNIIRILFLVAAAILAFCLLRWMLGEVRNDLVAFWNDLMVELDNLLNPTRAIDELLRPF